MRVPSLDQRGPPVVERNEVSCESFEPSFSHTQISLSPLRSEANAILFPSGENLRLQVHSRGANDLLAAVAADGFRAGCAPDIVLGQSRRRSEGGNRFSNR